NGHREFIEVDRLPNIFSGPSSTRETSSEAGIKKMGDKTIMSRPKVDSFLQNMNKVLQDSRMVPNFQDGVVNGFKIFAIRQGSVFDQLGLRNGDVVQEINGVKIDSMEKALPMLELLKNESNIGIGISRGGAKKNLSIEIQ